MTSNQSGKVKEASDIDTIEVLMHDLIGEVCWRARISYGNELRLDIGARLPNAAFKDREKGAWMLGAQESGWLLSLAGSTYITSKDDLKLVRQRISLIEGNRISALKVGYPELDLEFVFGDLMRLRIVPIWDDSSNLPHWELFMPNSRLLQVGPRTTWTYHRSDIPLSKLNLKK